MKHTLFFVMLSNFALLHTHDASWAQATLAQMSLREKIGQLFMVATASSFDQPEEALASQLFRSPYKMDHDYIQELIRDYHVGGIIFLFKSTPQQQIALTNKLQELSRIPLLIGQDCEWGLSMRLYDTIRFPRNMTLGAITDTGLLYRFGYEVGVQCRALGVHINFAPVVDVNNNPCNPVIHDRSFGDDPYRVTACATRIMQGMQEAGILTCAKHFPGHGDTAIDSHRALPMIPHTRDRLDAVELLPFRSLIPAGVDAIMTAHIVVPALCGADELPATLSSAVLTKLLRGTFNFKGLIITDGLGMQALSGFGKPGELELKAVLAGNDIVLCPLDVPAAVALIEQAVQDGSFTEQQLDEKVLRILQAKEWLGLIDSRAACENIDLQQLHTDHAYAAQKALYSQAITLLDADDPLTFPLASPAQAVLIGVDQSTPFQETLQTYGIPTVRAVKQYEAADLVTCIDADVVIVGVYGMNKWADRHYGIDPQLHDLLAHVQAAGKRTILVLFGTPYSIAYFDSTHTIIMAYEDDPCAQCAAARVIGGGLQPRGRLPVTITRSAS